METKKKTFIDRKHKGKNGKLILIANKQPFFSFLGKYKTKKKKKKKKKRRNTKGIKIRGLWPLKATPTIRKGAKGNAITNVSGSGPFG